MSKGFGDLDRLVRVRSQQGQREDLTKLKESDPEVFAEVQAICANGGDLSEKAVTVLEGLRLLDVGNRLGIGLCDVLQRMESPAE